MNGIGEGKEADIGIAGGQGMGILFKRGKLVKKVPSEELMDVLIDEVELMASEQHDAHEEEASSPSASPVSRVTIASHDSHDASVSRELPVLPSR